MDDNHIEDIELDTIIDINKLYYITNNIHERNLCEIHKWLVLYPKYRILSEEWIIAHPESLNTRINGSLDPLDVAKYVYRSTLCWDLITFILRMTSYKNSYSIFTWICILIPPDINVYTDLFNMGYGPKCKLGDGSTFFDRFCTNHDVDIDNPIWMEIYQLFISNKAQMKKNVHIKALENTITNLRSKITALEGQLTEMTEHIRLSPDGEKYLELKSDFEMRGR